jgi:hypothetical protein
MKTEEKVGSKSSDNFLFTYESSRYNNLMEEYLKLCTISECRKWKENAETIALYMDETSKKVTRVISIEKMNLRKENDPQARVKIEIAIGQLESFDSVIQAQLGSLYKTIKALPKGNNEGESILIPPAVLPKSNGKSKNSNSRLLIVFCIVMIGFITSVSAITLVIVVISSLVNGFRVTGDFMSDVFPLILLISFVGIGLFGLNKLIHILRR